jgi:uncharacterized protein with HEPN domain
MPKDKSYLFDIFHACELIEQFTKGIDFNSFQADVMRQDAIIRRIEIIGEASSNLSDEFKEKHGEIPWALIKGMRNRLVHEYNEVDLELVWTTSQEDIPHLIELLKPHIGE